MDSARAEKHGLFCFARGVFAKMAAGRAGARWWVPNRALGAGFGREFLLNFIGQRGGTKVESKKRY
ncbi:MAG: hypothetical protein ROO76_20690, partial [Terriglobia bacterium]|nr:hypothetical protein [Terriglobia bacterium]